MTDGGSLAIDAGQSGIKVRHADAAGASEWAGPGIRTDLPLLPQLARVMEDAVDAGRSFDAVGLGVSGLTSDEADAGYLLAATAQHGVRAVHLAHDSITAYLGEGAARVDRVLHDTGELRQQRQVGADAGPGPLARASGIRVAHLDARLARVDRERPAAGHAALRRGGIMASS